MKTTVIYHISPGYSRVSLWEGDPDNGQRICRTTYIPTAARTRTERYMLICCKLAPLGVPKPLYMPTKKESRHAR